VDFKLTPDQELMRDSIRRLVERDVNPLLEQHDPNQPLPKSAFLAVFGKLAELGLTAARLPEEAGGPGITMLDYGIMFEHIPPAIALSLIAQEATTSRIECGLQRRAAPALPAGFDRRAKNRLHRFDGTRHWLGSARRQDAAHAARGLSAAEWPQDVDHQRFRE